MVFKTDDRVEIHSTTSEFLDGMKGTVVGRSAVTVGMVVYIVNVDTPVISDDGFVNKAIAMTEHCLRPEM